MPIFSRLRARNLSEAFDLALKRLDAVSVPKGSPARAEGAGDEDRRFAARKEIHQSADWWIFHTPLREK